MKTNTKNTDGIQTGSGFQPSGSTSRPFDKSAKPEPEGLVLIGQETHNMESKNRNTERVYNYYFTVGCFDYVTATKAEAEKARTVTIRATGKTPRIYRFLAVR
jgi:hypothetical protein